MNSKYYFWFTDLNVIIHSLKYNRKLSRFFFMNAHKWTDRHNSKIPSFFIPKLQYLSFIFLTINKKYFLTITITHCLNYCKNRTIKNHIRNI